MKIHIYDTHVKTVTGQHLHFDILVDDEHVLRVSEYVESHLKSLGITSTQITTSSCQFCHSEIGNSEVKAAIRTNGHYVLLLND